MLALSRLGALNVSLRLIGSGEMLHELRELAGRLGLERKLEFVEPMTHTEVLNEYLRSDAVLVPSRWDTFPMTVCEGQAAGALVIGTRTGGIVEQIEHMKTGLLVGPGDPNSLASAVEWVAMNRIKTEAIRYQAWEHARRTYSARTMAIRTLEAYAG
jgi:glycogen(starch) synthase